MPGKEEPSVGQSASAMVQAMMFNIADGSACTPYAGLLVTAPDDTESTRLPWGNDGCSERETHLGPARHREAG
jgi:hypothetical protein